jgi:hypothetical protein
MTDGIKDPVILPILGVIFIYVFWFFITKFGILGIGASAGFFIISALLGWAMIKRVDKK